MYEAALGSMAVYIVFKILFTRSKNKLCSTIESEFYERRKAKPGKVSYIGQGRRNSESNAEKVA